MTGRHLAGIWQASGRDLVIAKHIQEALQIPESYQPEIGEILTKYLPIPVRFQNLIYQP